MGAMGVSTTVIALTSVAFAVTGISAKINEAASDVFGEDLVQIGSLFGAAFGAVGGLAGAGAEIGAANALSDASYAGADWSGVADAAGGMDAAGVAANAIDYGGVTNADAITSMGGDAGEFNLSSMGNSATPTSTMGAAPAETAARASPMDVANETQKPASLIPNTGAAARQTGPTVPQAAASPQTVPTNAAAPIASPAAGQRSFFEKLVFDKDGSVSPGAMKLGGQVLGGIGQGYVAAQKEKADKERFDRQMAMYGQSTGIRSTQ